MMYLEKFMNENSDWQVKLAAAPYCISTKFSNEYCILKYDILRSSMNLPEVREARGAIFRQDDSGHWICVCFPFLKFMNYGEEYSDIDKIDWSTASIQQKVDGSLIKFFYDKSKWCVATNNTIDSRDADCGSCNYHMLVEQALEYNGITLNEFTALLDTNYCYMFELTTPFNRIVVHYEGYHLWFLGRRNMTTHQEDNYIEPAATPYVKTPARFPYHSLAECIEAAHKMNVDEEGYVVCDAQYHRVKVKGEEYLKLHKLRGNGPITAVKVISLWQLDSIDDFIAYFPEHIKFVDDVAKKSSISVKKPKSPMIVFVALVRARIMLYARSHT